MRPSRVPVLAVFGFWLLASAVGCGGPALDESGGSEPEPPLSPSDQALSRKLEAELSNIINTQTTRYVPLQYAYSEGLLTILDQVEPFLSGEPSGDPPRFMPGLDAEEELSHFRETVRRWEARTGKDLRTEVDRFKADVAARKPGKSFHPEFQAKFSQTFDDLIAIEVAELRERRNQAIHAEAETLLAPHRESSPEVVRRLEQLLNTPPYNLPAPGSAESSPPKTSSRSTP